ncbi:FecR family protein [Pedobacter sp. ok626]|uniref:FecR family protein n=1 Tax=Pedobacter sp. ok626 TaxID=1761882 RepID=UPI000887A141|nr:FecR domain-containing protein [Pedobacter sp. ok626]SDL15977.1 FecR family protein [Pedobacter sp. ok626]
MDRHEARSLVDKYIKGNCSEEEKAIVESWYVQLPYLADAPSPGQIIAAKDNVWDQLMSQRQNKQRLYYRVGMTAAAVLLIGFGAFWFFNKSFYPESNLATTAASDIAPGSNKATLTLADGKTINLSGDKTGVKIKETALTYDDGSAIPSNDLAHVKEQILVATTPKGGTYKFMLPDGTAVWLNAATTLRFPSSFKGLSDGQNRNVELTGEAYFEVAKDKSHPFIIKTKLQEVKVLGTQFNVNSYPDDDDTKTTLLEGSVRILSSDRKDDVLLRPNQQSIVTTSNIRVKTVDPEDIISWKTGDFSFSGEPLGSIMKKIARWYNVDVVYVDKTLAGKLFGGTISRYEKIAEVLHLLEVTGEVKFKINGRTVTVTNK